MDVYRCSTIANSFMLWKGQVRPRTVFELGLKPFHERPGFMSYEYSRVSSLLEMSIFEEVVFLCCDSTHV